MKKERKASYKFFQNKKCEFFPCHKIAKKEDFNCLFCYCPLYAMGRRCGGNYKYLSDNTKDCSDCSMPHEYQNYDLIMDRVAIMVDQVKINNPNYKITELLIATTNANKIREIKSIITHFHQKELKIMTLNDFPSKWTAPAETGVTFEENALIKAEYYGNLFQMMTIVDDSGLEVKGLDDFPGVQSATWQKNKPQWEKNQLIVEMVKQKTPNRRQAQFCCTLVFYDPKIKFKRVFKGVVLGHISQENTLIGKYGFGFDSIFVVDKYKKLMANLTLAEKNKISHRGKAMMGFCAWLDFFS